MCKMILLWIIEVFLMLSLLLEDAFPLKDVVLSIEPRVVQRLNQSTLRCGYDLEDQALYTVKWYRGPHEFYRYTPGGLNVTNVFPVGGIIVNLDKSNSTQVVIQEIEFNLSGNFTCEVTVDKTFSTREDTQSMLVVQLPDSSPKISVGWKPLNYGDTLRANCSSGEARPKATLKFLLNNLVVARSDPLLPRHYYHSEWSDLSLDMVLSEVHFDDGKLILKCVARIEDIYSETAELRLASAREPVPERVSAFFSAGSSSTRDALHLVIICFITLMFS